jgi:hypothetical protein
VNAALDVPDARLESGAAPDDWAIEQSDERDLRVLEPKVFVDFNALADRVARAWPVTYLALRLN